MVASRWLLCVAFTVVCGAPPEEKKKLRNVIITSFGEMPYEPAEGFFQSDVFPVDIDGVLKEQTMDVALRTGILVEDPNEKKEEESAEDEDDVTSTNLKRQVSDGERVKGVDERRSSHKRNPKRYEDGEIITGTRSFSEGETEKAEGEHDQSLRRSHQRNPKGYGDEEIGKGTRSFGYEFRQSKEPSLRNYDNLNTGGSLDIGEGWNLRDADAILQGRNYNLLHTQGPRSYPLPAPREMPPPAYNLGGPPVFYPFPQFDHGFPTQRRGAQIVPAKYNTQVDNYDRSNSRVQTVEQRQFRDKREWFPSTLDSQGSRYAARGVRFPSPQTVYYSDYYLRGI